MAVVYVNQKKGKAFFWNYFKNLKREITLNEHYRIKSLVTSSEVMYYQKFEKIFDGIIKERESRKKAFTMFDCDDVFLSDFMFEKTDAEYIFMGFPYDLGSSQYGGSKFGPSALRYVSTSILENSVLKSKGIKIGDLGDIKGPIFNSNGKEFKFLSCVVEYLICNNKFPIVLGGDHSISFATIMGLCESVDGFGVIQFDAHQDFMGFDSNNWNRHLNHANFLDFVIGKNELMSITQLGIRNNNFSISHPKIESFSVEDTIEKIDQIIDSLDKNIPYFITFDVDCLSTAIMQSTGTPLPGGFEFREISKILVKIISSLNILGMDIVELSDERKLDAATINQLLILILSEHRRI
ncbi:arginase family protein [Aerococcaceae bacterium zg-ZJ1578]|uniref:arginase family protein n=1 Tax=Aerococcaceae bacterium zg-252 TaxID=2796928 RepID=UPI001A2EA6B8|nr:arginase family protein [Aerococcaceae bacterium zg-1578]